MSRLARLFVLALLTVAFSGVSSVAAADQVSGSGTYGMGTDTVGFSISAEAGPAGEDPIGTLTVDFPGAAPVAAQVQCLSVPYDSPSFAVAVGLARVTSAGAPFQQVEFYFGDFGTPSPGHDRAEISPVTDPVCPPDFAIGPETGSPLETGQLVVKAAEVGL